MSTAATVQDKVTRSRERFFSADDFSDLPRAATVKSLERLAEDGELVRVRRGMYFRGKRYRWGMARPDERSLVEHMVGKYGVGPAGLSAANHLGLTTQMPAKSHYAVTGTSPRDLPAAKFVSRQRVGRRDHKLRWLEVAILEVLDDWTTLETTPERAVATIASLIRGNQADPNRLARASKSEPAHSRMRLRVVLEASGHSDLVDSVPPASHSKRDWIHTS